MNLKTIMVAIAAGSLAAAASFFLNAGAENGSEPHASQGLESAIFAGGCFWCVESDFDKLEGVIETISGYSGGTSTNPTYETHSKDGHLETVKVIYDPKRIDYSDLVDYFFRHVDPTDDGGQFCDRGNAYRTAIFVDTASQRVAVQNLIQVYQERQVVMGPIVTRILDKAPFYPAETYHQNFAVKNPTRYAFYRRGCGRDEGIAAVWSKPGS